MVHSEGDLDSVWPGFIQRAMLFDVIYRADSKILYLLVTMTSHL